MILALSCKDCVAVFIVHALWNGQKRPFFETVEVKGEVAGGFNACIVEQLVHHTRGAVCHTFDGAEVVDGAKHLVGLSGERTVFQQCTESRPTFGQTGFLCCRDGCLEGVFSGLANSFQQDRPRMIGSHLGEGLIDLDGRTIQFDFNVPSLHRNPHLNTFSGSKFIQLIDNLVLRKTIQNKPVLSISKAKPT